MPDAPKPPDGEPSGTAGSHDPVRRLTLIVLGGCAVVFIWYILADRHTPYTDLGRVRTLVVPIVPRVSGHLTEIGVRLHSVVAEGDTLFQIDRRPYELAGRTAETAVEEAAQEVGSQAAAVRGATGRLGVARAQLDRAQRNYDRVMAIMNKNPGALSLADKDRAETGLDQALERVSTAEADLEKAQEQLGLEGPENTRFRSALVALEDAQLNLAFTTIQAPYPGVIESFNVDVGHYAQAGQPLATFIANHDVWIQADMRENNLENIKPGDTAEIVLDIAPGRVLRGTVRSTGYGVSANGTPDARGELPTVSGSKGWLRDPQRFPVVITLEDDESRGLCRAGGQADVVVFTGGNPVLNALARLRIRVTSILSYVR